MKTKTKPPPTAADVAAISWDNATLIREMARRALNRWDMVGGKESPEARDIVALFQLENTLRKEAIGLLAPAEPGDGQDLEKKFAGAIEQAYGPQQTPQA